MKKKDFYTKIILFILIVLVPLTLAGVMIVLSDGAGMIIGGVAMLAIDVYFGVRLYGFIKEKKDMLI